MWTATGKYCNRCTAACCAPATGSAPAKPVSVFVAITGRQQAGQILPKSPPLRQPGEQLVETGRVILQRTRSRRTHRTNHPTPQRSTEHLPNATQHTEERLRSRQTTASARRRPRLGPLRRVCRLRWRPACAGLRRAATERSFDAPYSPGSNHPERRNRRTSRPCGPDSNRSAATSWTRSPPVAQRCPACHQHRQRAIDEPDRPGESRPGSSRRDQ